MAPIQPPAWLSGTGIDYDPYQDRLVLEALLGGPTGGGIVGYGDLKITEKSGTPNMTVDVAAGHAFVDGTEAAAQGVYHGYNDATYNVAIAAADATNARKDLIVARVKDATYSGSANEWEIVAVAGTPAASPAEPAAPANSLVLALIDVPASDTAITNSQITDRRTRARTIGSGPRGYLGHGVQASDVTLTTTVVTVASAAVNVEANRRIRVTGKVFSITDADNNANYVSLNLDDSTTVFDAMRTPAQASVDQSGAVVTGYYETTAAGALTFRLRALTDAGNATLVSAGSGPGPYARALVIVEDIGST